MQVATLDDYLLTYGNHLAKQAQERTNPLHVPGRDDPLPGLNHLVRQMYPAQAHASSAVVKALRRQKCVFLCGEIGSGKTLMGVAAVHEHAAGKPYRALYFCPGQLIHKIEREIRQTVPPSEVQVYQISNWKDVAKLIHRPQLASPATWYIIARDRAKLGYGCKAGHATAIKLTSTGVQDQLTYQRVPVCAQCGQPHTNTQGAIITPDPDKRPYCKNFVTAYRINSEGEMVAYPRKCGAALWQADSKPRRIAPAHLIHKKLNGYFDYLVLDEVHEEKSANSLQADAAGALVAACRKVVCLTGTLIGGYANHLRPLLFRTCPQSLVAEGLSWHKPMEFDRRYGRLQTTIIEKDSTREGTTRKAYGKASKGRTVRNECRPGIMPTIFGRHLMGNTVFLGLNEISANLPSLDDDVAPVEMDEELHDAYKTVETDLRTAVADMMRKKDRRLLAAFLRTLLDYPDYPYGWGPVGYRDGDKFVQVAYPQSLKRQLRNKEKALLDLIETEHQHGRQCWVYTIMTDKRDCAEHLRATIKQAGYRVDVLRSKVDLTDREAWINEHGPNLDVVISHPRLVKTGLDFFDKQGSYNFPTLIFYQTGYDILEIRQAAGRAYRLAQTKSCKVRYLYYKSTMQDQAIALVGEKFLASKQIEGNLTNSEGLLAMASGACMEMLLAQRLVDHVDANAYRTWEKLGGRENPQINKYAKLLEDLARLRIK